MSLVPGLEIRCMVTRVSPKEGKYGGFTKNFLYAVMTCFGESGITEQGTENRGL